jgi:hypothetical protein
LAAPASTDWRGWLFALGMALAVPATADVFNREDVILAPVPDHFSVCFNGSCKELSVVGLSAEQWRQVRETFTPPAPDPEAERKQIAAAIALMERFVGKLTDTAHDLGRNDVGNPGDNWMDCIDESTNTTSYLKIFAAQGLLKWHTVQDRQTRGWFLFGYPHTSAVIRDTQSGQEYAVDSWFYPNGVAPAILPVGVWHDGWNPPPTP